MFPSSFGCRMMVGRNANEVSKTLEFCLRMRYYLHATLIKIRRDCYAYVLVKNDGFMDTSATMLEKLMEL